MIARAGYTVLHGPRLGNGPNFDIWLCVVSTVLFLKFSKHLANISMLCSYNLVVFGKRISRRVSDLVPRSPSPPPQSKITIQWHNISYEVHVLFHLHGCIVMQDMFGGCYWRLLKLN